MKRLGLFVCIALFAVVLFGGFLVPGTVLAQGTFPNCDPGFTYIPGTCIVDAEGNGQTIQGNSASTDIGKDTVAGTGADIKLTDSKPKVAPNLGQTPTKGCSLFGTSAISACISEGVQWLIKNTLLEIAGFLLWLTTNMFNYAIQIGVLDFKGWAPDELYPIWIIIRQIISLFIVFIGLYLGLMYILGKDEKFQKYIPWVIMFALFVSFSYPLVRTAVDISNVVSLNIYASAVGADALNPGSDANAGSLIVGKLGLQGLASSAVAASEGKTADGKTGMLGSINSIPGALLAVCYVLYAAYIFFMVTALFVVRTAALVFLIVASPLLLVDSVFPMLGEKAKLLRKILFEQLAVAPIFMIMLALTLKFLDVFSTTGKLSSTQFGSGISGGVNDNTIVVFFNILMMLIMLWIMLKVTKSAAGSLGEYATSAMGTVGGFALGAAAGGTGLLARKGLGGLAAKARDSKWVTNNQDSFMGRRAYNLSNSVANSTFDLRNSSVAQKYSGKIGMSMGMGAKMGYDEESKKKVAEIEKRGARIKTKYERDLVKDGKVVARKGDVDVEGVAAKERFYQNNGGAIFLTQKQQEELNSSFIDESSSKDITDYKKQPNKAAKADFARSLSAQLEKLTKDEGGTSSPRAQALMRTIYDIKKQEEDEKKAFDLQLEKEIDRYNRTAPEKRKGYLARLEKDMDKAITSSIDPLTGDASFEKYKSSQVPVPKNIDQALQQAQQPKNNQPLTGTALRQEPIKKVEERGAESVENQKQIVANNDGVFSGNGNQGEASTSTNTATQPQQNIVNSVIVDQNGRNFQYTVDKQSGAVDIIAPFDISKVNFSAGKARGNRPTTPIEGTVIPSDTKKAPTTPASNSREKQAA